jgi:serine/threonine-protein kinase
MDPLAPPFQVALPGIPQVGDVIAEKYRVEAILGVGGMGVVLSARHLKLGQVVAIKVLTVSEDQQKDSVERFLREGRAAAGLSSDHVVRIYDLGQLDDGTPFMVMERLRGQDLAEVLVERGPLSVEEAVEYTAQATMAIAEAHEVGVVHRDLKPSNLFLTQRSDGSACIKVLDFGISKQLSMFESHTLRADLTQTRQVMGSPAYMSPEQVRDARSVDHRTDIWALGTTLYELLTRHVAFDADTLPAVCAAIAADPPIPIEVHRGDVPDIVADIVMRCLEKVPAKRFQSARALLTALRAYQGRPDMLISSRDVVLLPKTTASVKPERACEDEPVVARSIKESGARSVGQLSVIEGQDQTLMSGRVATDGKDSSVATDGKDSSVATDGKDSNIGSNTRVSNTGIEGNAPATVASYRRRRKRTGFLLIAVLGLVGTGTAVVSMRSRAPLPVAPSPVMTSFTLRIESEPSGATVFEGARWFGETPIVFPIDKATVMSRPRQFTLRKEGYLDTQLIQGDSPSDRQVQVKLTASSKVEIEPVSSATSRPESALTVVQGTGPARGEKRPVETKLPSSGLRSRSATGANHVPAVVTNAPPSDIRIVR